MRVSSFRSILADAIHDSRMFLRAISACTSDRSRKAFAGQACLAMDVPFESRVEDCQRAFDRALARAQAAYKSYA